jgi:hypothetical protein
MAIWIAAKIMEMYYKAKINICGEFPSWPPVKTATK